MNTFTSSEACDIVGVAHNDLWTWVRRGYVAPTEVTSEKFYRFDAECLQVIASVKEAMTMKRESTKRLRELLKVNCHPLARV